MSYFLFSSESIHLAIFVIACIRNLHQKKHLLFRKKNHFYILATYRINTWIRIGVCLWHSIGQRVASKNYAYLHQTWNYAVKGCHDVLEQLCKIWVNMYFAIFRFCIFYCLHILTWKNSTPRQSWRIIKSRNATYNYIFRSI